MYLMAVRDRYSRYVVVWALGQTLERRHVLEAIAGVIARTTAEIRNSDRGRHFTSPQYIRLLIAAAVRITGDERSTTCSRNGSGAR